MKPIILLKVTPESFHDVQLWEIQDYYDEKFTDYHVLVVPLYNNDKKEPIKMEVFYEKDFTTQEKGALRERINTALEKLKENTDAKTKYY